MTYHPVGVGIVELRGISPDHCRSRAPLAIHDNSTNQLGNTGYVVKYKHTFIIMEILAQTDNRLVLQHKPIDYWNAGKICLILGLTPLIYVTFSMTVASVVANLSCGRSLEKKINCQLEQFNIVGRRKILKISEPQAAKVVAEKESSGRNITSYQVLILTRSEKYPLLAPNNDRQKSQQITDQINKFLTSEQKTLALRQD